MHANVVSLENHPAHTSAAERVKTEKTFDALKAHTLKYSHALMQGMFDSADDTLFEMAEKAENNSDQAIYFDSMRIIRLKRKEVENSFCQQIDQLFFDYQSAISSNKSTSNSSSADDNNPSEFSCDNLSLMEEIDLEESLAISTLSDKIRSNYSTEIHAIEKRLAHLKPDVTTAQGTNPFDAKNICTSFQKATEGMDTEIKIKLIVYKLFDQHLSKSIGQLYKEINTKFIDAGILPTIKTSTRKVSSETALSRQSSQTTDNNDNMQLNTTVPENIPENTNEILIPLQQLLAQAHLAASPVIVSPELGGTNSTNSCINSSRSNADSLAARTITTGTSEQVVNALSQLQQQHSNTTQISTSITNTLASLQTSNPQEISSHIKSILHEQVSSTAGQEVNLNAVDSGIIDIVSMLFEFILDDDNLPAAAKAEIARLQIPLLKVAIIDKEFFNTKGHPARILLNMLAKSGLGLDESSTAENNPILAKITSTVEQILNDFQNDFQLFSSLLNEFNDFISFETERDQSSEQTVIKAFERKEEISLAQAWVNETLEEALHGKTLPEKIIKIIHGPWAKVMQHTYLEKGKNCSLWKNQLRFIDVLVWSIEPKQIPLDRKKLGHIVKHLIQTLRAGLNEIQYPHDKSEKLFNALEAYHLASIRGMEYTESTAKHISDSTAQEDSYFFLFKDDNCLSEDHLIEEYNEADFLFSESEHSSVTESVTKDSISNNIDSLNLETTSETNPVEQAIQDMEQQVASLSELETMLEDMLEDPEEFSTDKIILEDIVLTGWEEQESPEDHPQDEYLDLARHLDAGKWVEFVNNEGKTQRAKLAWKSDLLGEYTFLNWKFDVVADKTLFGLAAELRSGRAKVINDIPILDRALGAVFSGLKKTA